MQNNVSYLKLGPMEKLSQRRRTALKMSEMFEKLSGAPYSKTYEDARFYGTQAQRLSDCSTFAMFKICSSNPDHKRHLELINSCHSRFCPVCMMLKSRRMAAENLAAFYWIAENTKCKVQPLLATFTIKNVTAEELPTAVTKLMDGYRRMLRGWSLDRKIPKTKKNSMFFRRTKSGKLGKQKYVKTSDVLLGSVRALEVTYNKKTRMFHPHIHALFYLNADLYFPSSKPHYITADEWRERWAWSMNLDYIPQVRLGRSAGTVETSHPDYSLSEERTELNTLERSATVVFEVSKYVSDFSFSASPKSKSSLYELSVISSALHRRQLHQYTGIARKARQALSFSDPDSDDDLVTPLAEECMDCNSPLIRELSLFSKTNYVPLKATQEELRLFKERFLEFSSFKKRDNKYLEHSTEMLALALPRFSSYLKAQATINRLESNPNPG